MREKLFSAGVESFHDHELLEMFLYSADARKNTNDPAHLLIDNFGSLGGVFSASPDALKSVEGVGDAATAQIMIVRELMKRLETENMVTPEFFENRTQLYEYIVGLFKYSSIEELYMLMFDGKDRFIGNVLISRGNENTVGMNIRKMASEALKKETAGVVIAHNHPNGKLMASMEDVVLTRDVSLAFSKIDIAVVDHILVSGKNYTSIMNSSY